MIPATHGIIGAGKKQFRPLYKNELESWFDFFDEQSLSFNSGAISGAIDKMAKGHNIVQTATPARQPVWGDALNGLKGAVFDGTKILVGNSFIWALGTFSVYWYSRSVPGASGEKGHWTERRTASANPSLQLSGGNVGSRNYPRLFVRADNNGDVIRIDNQAVIISDNNPVLQELHMGLGTYTYVVNGTVAISGSYNAASSVTLSNFAIGGSKQASESPSFIGTMYQHLVYNTKHDTTKSANVRAGISEFFTS